MLHVLHVVDLMIGLIGVQVSNSGQSYEDRIPFVTAVVMLLVDAFVYLVLAWYLDKARTLLQICHTFATYFKPQGPGRV